MKTSELIRHYRKQAGLTQKELANRLSIKQQNLSQYESGDRTPKLTTLSRIAAALGISPELLLDDSFKADLLQPALTPAEVDAIFQDRLLNSFNQLNRSGKEKAVEYTELLNASGNYKPE